MISRIRTGATRFERSFLWTHRKFISTIFFSLGKETRWSMRPGRIAPTSWAIYLQPLQEKEVKAPGEAEGQGLGLENSPLRCSQGFPRENALLPALEGVCKAALS